MKSKEGNGIYIYISVHLNSLAVNMFTFNLRMFGSCATALFI